MASGEFGSSLAIVIVPFTVVVLVGVKLSVRLLLAPAASCIGVVKEPSEKPAPTRLTAVMFKFVLPMLEICMVCEFFCPTTTF